MSFQFFDKDEEVQITFRHLPHWEQAGATYFITFRTADSIPAPVWNRMKVERAQWLRRHDIDSQQPNWREALRLLAPAFRREFHEAFIGRWMEELRPMSWSMCAKAPAPIENRG